MEKYEREKDSKENIERLKSLLVQAKSGADLLVSDEWSLSKEEKEKVRQEALKFTEAARDLLRVLVEEKVGE